MHSGVTLQHDELKQRQPDGSMIERELCLADAEFR